jgi:nucleoside-diphosphate-sugar epimerase
MEVGISHYSPPMRVLIIGCGYVGEALGSALVAAGHQVFGLRRSADACALVERAGISPLIADITNPATLAQLNPAYDWVINTVSSGGGTAGDYRSVYLQGTKNVLDWLAPKPPQKFIYTSSTSVYGQNDGSLVTEQSSTEPDTETARILVQTEQLLLNSSSIIPAIVLRLAAIYGPGRGYWFKQFLAGDARIEGSGSRYLNMVHRDDVVGSIMAALETALAGSIYNVVDDEPVTQIEFFRFLAGHFNRPLPAAIPQDSVPRKRGATNKRVSNARLKRELHYEFKYPSFRDAIRTSHI